MSEPLPSHSPEAWANMIDATIGVVGTDAAAMIGSQTTNSGEPCPRAGARWLLMLASGWLRKRGRDDGPIAAFDFASDDFAALLIVPASVPVLRPEWATDTQSRVSAEVMVFFAKRLPEIWRRNDDLRSGGVTA